MAAADQPGQAAHQGRRQPFTHAAAERRAERLRGRAARAVPDLQRGLHRQLRGRRCTAPTWPREAIRLTRLLHRLLPDDGEVAGLLALMLLTDARRGARAPAPTASWSRWPSRTGRCGTRPHRRGHRADQPRRWPAGRSARTSCRRRSPPCTTRRRAPRTPTGRRSLALYELLERIAPNPMVTLNRAVAVAMVDGPGAGLALLDALRRSRMRRGPPAARGPRAPAGDGGDLPRRPVSLPAGRPADRQPPGAALPGVPGRPRWLADCLVVTSSSSESCPGSHPRTPRLYGMVKIVTDIPIRTAPRPRATVSGSPSHQTAVASPKTGIRLSSTKPVSGDKTITTYCWSLHFAAMRSCGFGPSLRGRSAAWKRSRQSTRSLHPSAMRVLRSGCVRRGRSETPNRSRHRRR